MVAGCLFGGPIPVSTEQRDETDLDTTMSVDDWYCLMDNDGPNGSLAVLEANFALAPPDAIGTPEYRYHKKIIEYRRLVEEGAADER